MQYAESMADIVIDLAIQAVCALIVVAAAFGITKYWPGLLA